MGIRQFLLLFCLFCLASTPFLTVRADDDEVEDKFQSGFECEFDTTEPSWEFELDQNDEEYEIELVNLFELSVNGSLIQTALPTPFSSITWSGSSSPTAFQLTSSKTSSFKSITVTTPAPADSKSIIGLQFSFEISDYQWTSTDPNAGLVAVYSFDYDGHNEIYDYGNSSYPNAVLLNNAYFNISTTVSGSNSPVQIFFSGEEIWVYYPHFTSSLTHTIGFGFLDSAPFGGKDDDDDDGSESGGHGWVAAVILIPFAVVGVVGFLWWRRRRNNHSHHEDIM